MGRIRQLMGTDGVKRIQVVSQSGKSIRLVHSWQIRRRLLNLFINRRLKTVKFINQLLK